MLALRLIGEVEKEFGKRLPVSTVFTASTVVGFAAALGAERGPRQTPLVAGQTGGA